MAKHVKKYLEARQRIDREHEYTPADAVRLVKESKFSKFDESVEVHIRTGLNVRHADEQLRGTVEKALDQAFDEGIEDIDGLQQAIKDGVMSDVHKRTRRAPVVLPVVMEV